MGKNWHISYILWERLGLNPRRQVQNAYFIIYSFWTEVNLCGYAESTSVYFHEALAPSEKVTHPLKSSPFMLTI